MSDNENRRDALKIIGAIGATCAFPFSADELYGQTAHTHEQLAQAKQAASTGPRYFSQADWKTVSRIADLIIPETNTPGAVTAGVPGYIDTVVGGNERHKSTFRDGLEWLRSAARKQYGRDFDALSEDDQIALLTPLSNAVDAGRLTSPGDRLFEAMKNLTADGYFTSKAGLMEQLGYKGNSLVTEFPGCTHEH